jgi:hypothetical protein
MATIRPWFDASTYPFLPRPLNYLLVILIPLVAPAILLVVATFALQRMASALRVHRHFRDRKPPVSGELANEPQKEHKHPLDLEAQVDDSDTLPRSP